LEANTDQKNKQYCCPNPNCLKVFSEPLVIKYYACPKCQTLIDLNSEKDAVKTILTEKYALKEDQRQESNKQIEKQEKKITRPVLTQQDRIAESKIRKNLPLSSNLDVDSFTSKGLEPEEPTLIQRLEALVEEKNKESEKKNVSNYSDSECLHYFGFLNQRKKDEAMPETCVVCPRSIECLLSDSNNSEESVKEIKKWYSFKR
jgi:hypothetical protein